jgi:hypothetical protein
MLFDLIDLLSNSNGFVCAWRNGEFYIEPVTPAQVNADERLAA